MYGSSICLVVSLIIVTVSLTAAVEWGMRQNRDYYGNDLAMNNDYTLAQCTYSCEADNKCVGVVVDFATASGPGKCWLKSAFVYSTVKNGERYTYKLSRT